MSDQMDWAKVLQAAYESQSGVVQRPPTEDDDMEPPDEMPHNLLDETNLSREELDDAIDFLLKTELLSHVGSGVNYKLTNDGFSVAHDREIQRERQEVVESQAQFGKITTVLTGVLAGNAAIQAIATVVGVAPPLKLPLAVVFTLVAVVLIVSMKWRLTSPPRRRDRQGHFKERWF